MTAKPLDAWAREFAGCSDFDSYLRIGGSFTDARADIRKRIARLQLALYDIAADPPRAPAAETEDEPLDRQNAHPQGADEA
jgi:hypothetical protein